MDFRARSRSRGSPSAARDHPGRGPARSRAGSARCRGDGDGGHHHPARPVKDRQQVKKGQMLVELRSDEQRAALQEMLAQRQLALADEGQARAEERAAQASLKLAEVQLARGAIWSSRARSRRSRSTRHSATATTHTRAWTRPPRASPARRRGQRRRRRGRSGCARWSIRARIVSPIDGVVLAHQAEEGETGCLGRQLVTVADLSRTRVEAEVDEFDAPALREGAEVAVTVEGLPGKSFRGAVLEIPDEVVPRKVKPRIPDGLLPHGW